MRVLLRLPRLARARAPRSRLLSRIGTEYPVLVGLGLRTLFKLAGLYRRTMLRHVTFVGVTGSLEVPEWGSMIALESQQVFNAPHIIFFPGLAITLTVLGFNLLGDGLRDALDPRLNR